mgnify:CR=1 FL=1
MDLSKWKGKTLDGETLNELKAALDAHTESLEARATKAEDKARAAAKESIEGRKTLKARHDRMVELLGIEPDADLDNLPGPKGQADAAKQFEARVKRAERELADERKAHAELQSRYKAERRERAIAEYVAKHTFADPDVARVVIKDRVREEGDDILFEGDGGKLVSLEAGVAWLVKTKPHLVKAAGSEGAQGSGFKGNGSTFGTAKNPWSKDHFNLTEQVRLMQSQPDLAKQLQAAAA